MKLRAVIMVFGLAFVLIGSILAACSPAAPTPLPTPAPTIVPPTLVPPSPTKVPPTATAIPPSPTPVPPTATNTTVPPTATNTAVPPTKTFTPTNVPPTATEVPATNTVVPTRVPPTRIPPTPTAGHVVPADQAGLLIQNRSGVAITVKLSSLTGGDAGEYPIAPDAEVFISAESRRGLLWFVTFPGSGAVPGGLVIMNLGELKTLKIYKQPGGDCYQPECYEYIPPQS